MNPTLMTWLRRMAILLSITVLLTVGYYFLNRNRSNESRAEDTLLGTDVASATRQIEYMETRSGKPFLKVRASQNVATVEGLNQLQDVEVIYFGEEGVRQGVIRAEECFYSMTENVIRFRGNVHIDMGTGYSLTTSRMRYSKQSNFATGDAPFSFVAQGAAGTGQGFSLDLATRELTLLADVTLQYNAPAGKTASALRQEGPLSLMAGHALIQEEAGRISLSAGARLDSATSTLQGEEMVIQLSPQRELRELRCSGNAGYQRRGPVRDVRLDASDITFRMNPATMTPEQIAANGQASLRSDLGGDSTLSGATITIRTTSGGTLQDITADGDALFVSTADNRRVQGRSMTIRFGDRGQLDQILVHEHAMISQASTQGEVQFRGAEVKFRFRPESASTVLANMVAEPDAGFSFSRPDGDTLEGTCRRLEIRYDPSGRFPDKLLATDNNHWRFDRRTPREITTLTCASAQVDFFSQSMDPHAFRADGSVHIRQERPGKSWMETSSDRLEGALAAGDHHTLAHLVQEGSFHYRDAQTTIRARRAEMRENNLTLSGTPEINNAGTITKAETVDYDLKSGIIVGHHSVETRITPAGGDNTQAVLPWMGTADSSAPVFIHAEEIKIINKTGQVTYSGHCRMVQKDNILLANRFDWNRATNVFDAHDQVFIHYLYQDTKQTSTPLEINARDLRYDPAEKKMTLEGNVKTRTNQGQMTSDRLWGFFADKAGLRRLFAAGNIRIEQPDRQAFGTSAEMEPATKKIILRGDPARVIDLTEGRTTQGAQLTFFGGDDKILIENGRKSLE